MTDRIFTRIGSNDSIEKNSSSFVLEVNMTEHILKNVTANSLVIIDELYRSTNPREGLQLAWSFCEHLISKHGKGMSGEFFEESFTVLIINAIGNDRFYKISFWVRVTMANRFERTHLPLHRIRKSLR